MTTARTLFKRMLRLCAAGAAGLAASAALANPQALVGTWKGSIGGAPVMACFTAGEADYHYLRHMRAILLARPGDDGSLSDAQLRALPLEGYRLDEVDRSGDTPGVSGRWRFEGVQGDLLRGTWTSPSGDRSLPIRLSKLAPPPGADSGDVCGAAYFAPLRAAVRVKKEPARFASHVYTQLASEDAKAPELGAEVPHADAFNRFALDWLRDQAVFRYDCERGLSRLVGSGEPLGRELQPVFWNDRYLVLQDALPEVFCGGAHGNSSLSYVVWSLPQGKPIDPWIWIQGGQQAVRARDSADGPPVAPALLRQIIRQHPRNEVNDSCSEVMDAMWVDAPIPSDDGLVFNTSFFHAMRACNDQVSLNWRQLAPYLSREGRELMKKGR